MITNTCLLACMGLSLIFSTDEICLQPGVCYLFQKVYQWLCGIEET